MTEKENLASAQTVDDSNVSENKRDFSNVLMWSKDADDYVMEHYKPGQKCKVTVVKMPTASATVIDVVTVEEKIRGIIELEDLCWNLHSFKPDFKEGDVIEVRVKRVVTYNSKIEFTRLIEAENPWGEYAKHFVKLSVHSGTVVEDGASGCIVHLDYTGTPVEAFLRSSLVTNESLKKVLKVDAKLNFSIISIDEEKREIFVDIPYKENLEAVKVFEENEQKELEKKEKEEAEELEKMKNGIKTKYINVDFIYDLMSVPSYSRNEHRMQLYILNWARQRDIKVDCDNKGNLYLTKGELADGEVYPCVTSHMDTVQEKAKVYSDAGTRLEIVTSEVKLYTDKDKEFYGGDVKHKISVDGQGIGADCKAGIVICLSLMDKFDKMKAAFFVEEEIGMCGSKAMDETFFEDCGYCIGWDSPDLNRAAWKSSGTKLFSAEFHKKYLKPICDKWGLDDFRSEPFTDIINIREKSKLMCMNFGNGGYEAHCYTEYCIIEDMDHALGMGIDIVKNLGNKLYKSLPTVRSWMNGKPVGEPEGNMIKEGETMDEAYFSKEFDRWKTTYNYGSSNTSNNSSSSSSSNNSSSNNKSTTVNSNNDSVAIKYIIETYDEYLNDTKNSIVEVMKKFCEENGLDYESQLSEKLEAVYSKEITF